MTRKDYVLIAEALKEARSFHDASNPLTRAAADFNCGVSNAVRRLCDRMAQDNPRFDRERFLKAAGVQS